MSAVPPTKTGATLLLFTHWSPSFYILGPVVNILRHVKVMTISHNLKSFVVEAADDQWAWNRFLESYPDSMNDVAKFKADNIDATKERLILCAIIFAAFAAGLLAYLTVTFLVGKYAEPFKSMI